MLNDVMGLIYEQKGLAGIAWALSIQGIGMGAVFMVALSRAPKGRRIEIRTRRHNLPAKADE